MKTFLHKTGKRLPEWGSQSHFRKKDNGSWEVFIRGEGTHKLSALKFGKLFTEEDIPDLAKPFTDEQFIAYANQYGVDCAQEFLDCCDYYKHRAAQEILNPPSNIPSTADQFWFKSVFKREAMALADGLMWSIGNRYTLDVLKFERLLIEFGYNPRSNVSMNDFIVENFGVEACKKIRTTFMGMEAA